MINQKSLENLQPIHSKWLNDKTTTIRIPAVLKDDVLAFAKDIDHKYNEERIIKSYKSDATIDMSSLLARLKIIVEKIETGQKGYKSNSASQLIKDLKNLVE